MMKYMLLRGMIVAIITKVEIQKKNKDKVNVFVDDEFYHGLYLDTCIKYSLRENLEIDLERLDEIVLESEKYLAFNKVVAYIGEGLKTKKQIRDYLKKKEYSKNTIDYVIEKLIEYKYVDDEKYCETYIKTYRNKYGKNMLRVKLTEKGVSREIIDDFLNDFESVDDEVYGVLSKKLGNKTITNELLSKTYRFMSSRGFSFDETKSAIAKYKELNNLSFEEE